MGEQREEGVELQEGQGARKNGRASTPFESAGDVLASNASVAEAVPEQLADTQASSQVAEELPASPPRLEAPPAIQPCEGGGEHQPPPPPATSNLPAPLQEALKSFTVRLSAMVDDCLPQIVGEGLRDSLEKFELDNRVHQEVASTAKAEAEKTKYDMLMQGLEFKLFKHKKNTLDTTITIK